MRLKLTGILVVAFLASDAASSVEVRAAANLPNCLCTYTVPPLGMTGDDYYSSISWNTSPSWCGSPMVSLADSYGIKSSHWGAGYGFFQCDQTLPFARSMNAITALALSGPNAVTGTLFQFQTQAFPLIDWAYLWTLNKLDDTRGQCEHGDMKQFNASESGGTIKLYIRRSGSCQMGFFYGNDTAERAGILVHEARHVGGPGHYNTYQDFNFGSGGAYEFQATWLRQYAENGQAAPGDMRCSAADRAQTILFNNFVIPAPTFPDPEVCSLP